jgi:hypothetical protein
MKNVGKGISFLAVPVLSFILMELYEHNPFAEVRTEAVFFNILLFELFAWILFGLIGSTGWALRILLFCSMLFGITNHYIMLFRSTPFVPWDIYSIRTAYSVAGNYDFTPDLRMVLVTAAFAALVILVHFLGHPAARQKAPVRAWADARTGRASRCICRKTAG